MREGRHWARLVLRESELVGRLRSGKKNIRRVDGLREHSANESSSEGEESDRGTHTEAKLSWEDGGGAEERDGKIRRNQLMTCRMIERTRPWELLPSAWRPANDKQYNKRAARSLRVLSCLYAS